MRINVSFDSDSTSCQPVKTRSTQRIGRFETRANVQHQMEIHLGFQLQQKCIPQSVVLKCKFRSACASGTSENSLTAPALAPSRCASHMLQTSYIARLQKSCKTSGLSRHLKNVPLPLLRWNSNKKPCGTCLVRLVM